MGLLDDKTILVTGVLTDAFLQHHAEFFPERGELLRLVFGELREQIEHASRERAAHRLD